MDDLNLKLSDLHRKLFELREDVRKARGEEKLPSPDGAMMEERLAIVSDILPDKI